MNKCSRYVYFSVAFNTEVRSLSWKQFHSVVSINTPSTLTFDHSPDTIFGGTSFLTHQVKY